MCPDDDGFDYYNEDDFDADYNEDGFDADYNEDGFDADYNEDDELFWDQTRMTFEKLPDLKLSEKEREQVWRVSHFFSETNPSGLRTHLKTHSGEKSSNLKEREREWEQLCSGEDVFENAQWRKVKWVERGSKFVAESKSLFEVIVF